MRQPRSGSEARDAAHGFHKKAWKYTFGPPTECCPFQITVYYLVCRYLWLLYRPVWKYLWLFQLCPQPAEGIRRQVITAVCQVTVPSNENPRTKGPEASTTSYKGSVRLWVTAERIAAVVLWLFPQQLPAQHPRSVWRSESSLPLPARQPQEGQPGSTEGQQVARRRFGNSFPAHSTTRCYSW